jgi:hypothetical protein
VSFALLQGDDLPSINHLNRAIVLILMRALPACPATEALRPNAHTITDLDVLHRRAHLDYFADDFVAHGEGVRLSSSA